MIAVLSRVYLEWTEEEDDLLKVLCDEGKRSGEIGVAMGRSTSSIRMRKNSRGLFRGSTACERCTGPVSGRSSSAYCGPRCRAAAKRAVAQAARWAQRDWTCAAYNCTNQVTKDDIRRRYCSPACRGNTHERVRVRLPQQ